MLKMQAETECMSLSQAAPELFSKLSAQSVATLVQTVGALVVHCRFVMIVVGSALGVVSFSASWVAWAATSVAQTRQLGIRWRRRTLLITKGHSSSSHVVFPVVCLATWWSTP